MRSNKQLHYMKKKDNHRILFCSQKSSKTGRNSYSQFVKKYSRFQFLLFQRNQKLQPEFYLPALSHRGRTIQNLALNGCAVYQTTWQHDVPHLLFSCKRRRPSLSLSLSLSFSSYCRPSVARVLPLYYCGLLRLINLWLPCIDTKQWSFLSSHLFCNSSSSSSFFFRERAREIGASFFFFSYQRATRQSNRFERLQQLQCSATTTLTYVPRPRDYGNKPVPKETCETDSDLSGQTARVHVTLGPGVTRLYLPCMCKSSLAQSGQSARLKFCSVPSEFLLA